MPPPSVRPTATTSTIAAAAAMASITPANLAQLLQMAQSLKNPLPAQQSLKNPLPTQASRHHVPQHHPHTTKSSAHIINPISTTHHQHHHHNQNHTNRDVNEVIDMDVASPSPPQITSSSAGSNRVSSTTSTAISTVQTLWDQILKSTQAPKPSANLSSTAAAKRMATSSTRVDVKKMRSDHLVAATSSSSNAKHQHHRHQVVNIADSKKQGPTGNKLDQLTVLDDVPSSAVEMAVKEKV